MRKSPMSVLVSQDPGLLKHWREALHIDTPLELDSFGALQQLAPNTTAIVWLDMHTAAVPAWPSPEWDSVLRGRDLRVIAASSHPRDEEAIAALDRGCAGYCHAFSDPQTLEQVQQVVTAGHVWIGRNLMQQLIQTANRAKPTEAPVPADWEESLTAREREVAKMAAHGASNLAIAAECDITERTVKAHLSAVFEKLGVADRLQLALKVHGIQ